MPCLTLIVRRDCHLCADMRYTLDELQPEHGYDITECDVDADARLLERYDKLVPVLLLGSREICHYFVDAVALRDALAAWHRQDGSQA